MRMPSLTAARTRLPLLLLAGVGTLLAAADARADEIVLKSGKTRTGEVVSKDDRFVVVETRLGRIRIPAAEVVEIRRAADAGDAGTGGDASGDAEKPATPPAPAPAPPPSVRRPVVSRPAPAPAPERTGEPAPAPESGDATETETGNDGVAAALDPLTAGAEPAPPSDRLRRLRAARFVRRTTEEDEAAESAAASAAEKPAEATIGGRVLGKVPPGTEIIVFQPPRPFEPAPGAIEIGKRTRATMEMAGAASAWLTTAGADGEQRIAVRLADVKRHVEVTSPETRLRLFEGISKGDWVRIGTTSGASVQGRLDGLEDGEAQLTSVDRESGASKLSVPLDSIVTIDGVIRDTAAELALADIEPGELMAVTFWPSGEQVMGRHVDGPAGSLSLDVDGDGTADHTVLRQGPLAEVRRIPERFRELAQVLRPGNVVRVTYRDDVPDASIRQTMLGSVESLTAFALAVRDDDEAVIVPFDGISELVLIEDDPQDELARWKTRAPVSTIADELPVLPGMTTQEAAECDLPDGVSTVSDGRVVTHVFVSAPYAKEVLGVRIGEPESQSTRRSNLRFDTRVTPRISPDAAPMARQMISESIDGLRVVLLSDDLGVVTGLELSQSE